MAKYKVGDIIGTWEVIEHRLGVCPPYVVKCVVCGSVTIKNSNDFNKRCRECMNRECREHPELSPWIVKPGYWRGEKVKKYKVGDEINGWKVIEVLDEKDPKTNQDLYLFECPQCHETRVKKTASRAKERNCCLFCHRINSSIRGKTQVHDGDITSAGLLRLTEPNANRKLKLPRNVFEPWGVGNGFRIVVMKKGKLYRTSRLMTQPTKEDVIKFKRNLDIKI